MVPIPYKFCSARVSPERAADLGAYHDVWVFAEQRAGRLMPVVYELLGEGRRLATKIGCGLCALKQELRESDPLARCKIHCFFGDFFEVDLDGAGA